MRSSGSVSDSIACWAASSCDSGTSTFCGASSVSWGWCSTAVSSSDCDPGRAQELLDLLRLGDVLGQGDLNHPGHCTTSGSGAGSGASRRWAAPPLTRRGEPRSANGTSITSKSFGTTVSGKIVRASRAISGPK